MSAHHSAEAIHQAGYATRLRAVALGVRFITIVLGSLFALVAALVLGVKGWPLGLIELAFFGLVIGANKVPHPQIDRLLQGARGERDVGAELELLAPDGWHVLHNVSFGRGDVDHILIGPGGLFTIETKSHRGRIRVDRIERRMLQQPYAEKQLLERITGYKFEPLLVFSSAYLIGNVPARRNGVTILPARMLVNFISRQRPVVSTERASEVYERLLVAVLATPA